MTENRVKIREVFSLAYPSILSMISITLQNFIDAAFISHVGKPQLAAVGLTSWFIWTLLSFFRGITSVTNTFTARYLGSRRYRAIGVITWHMLSLSFLFGVLYFSIGFFSENIIKLINPPEEVYGYAVSYLRIRFYDGFFIIGIFVLDEFFRGLKKPQVSMVIIGIISILNVSLDYIFIFGKFGLKPMGVQGAAYATVIAEFCGFLIFLIYFLNRKNKYTYLTGRFPHLNLSLIKRIFNIGLPSGVQYVLDVGSFMVFGIIVTRMGTDALAINQIVIQILSLTFMPGIGFSKAATTLVSAYMGEKDMANARRSTYIATCLAMVIMMSVAFSFALFPHLYIGIFSRDKTMLSLGSKILLIAAIYEGFDAIGLVFSGALLGAGDTRFVMWTIILTAWGLFIPATFLLGIVLNMGILGAWLAMASYIIIFGIISLIRFTGKKWEGIKI